MALVLPQFVAIKSDNHAAAGNACYKDDGSVVLGEKSVFSKTVKIEVEKSTISEAYVNLRFCYSNKFWQKSADSNFIVARSNKPDEDKSKPSCTLFEAMKVDGNGVFYLRHVQSGGRLKIDNDTLGFYLDANPKPKDGYLGYVDLDSMVKLPTDSPIAFKNQDGLYLKAYTWDSQGTQLLQFWSSELDYDLCAQRVFLMDDGRIGLRSLHWSKFWRVATENQDYVLVDSSSAGIDDTHTLFQPVKVDEKTIVLRSVGNNLFCKRFSTEDYMVNILRAVDTSITDVSRLQVEELVLKRKIYRVVYKMDSSRIFNQTPYLAGTTTLTNNGDTEASMQVQIMYQKEVSYSFSNSLSVTLGVSTTIEAGLPGIESMSIEIKEEISRSMEWNTTTTTATSVTATGTVPVPAKSLVQVSYVGTKGTCNVPFEYVQEDVNAKDGSVTQVVMTDGIYTGVNCYNFDFVVGKSQPIGI